MKAKTVLLAAAMAATTLTAGCDRIKSLVGGKPKGQVVATVNGDEITVLDLKNEMQGFSARDPKVLKAAQQQALQQIIMRTLLTQKAKEEKLEKTPEFTAQVRRGEDVLLSQMYQQKLASGVATPKPQEANAYVAAHPEAFANRRLLVLEQLIAPANSKITPDQFKDLNTLDAVKGLYRAAGVPYQENLAVIDSLSADPQLISQIEKLPADEVFVIPQRGALVFNHIIMTRVAPFTGDMAATYATNLVRQRSAQQSVGKQLTALRKESEPKIVYNELYKPAEAKPAAPAPKAP